MLDGMLPCCPMSEVLGLMKLGPSPWLLKNLIVYQQSMTSPTLKTITILHRCRTANSNGLMKSGILILTGPKLTERGGSIAIKSVRTQDLLDKLIHLLDDENGFDT